MSNNCSSLVGSLVKPFIVLLVTSGLLWWSFYFEVKDIGAFSSPKIDFAKWAFHKPLIDQWPARRKSKLILSWTSYYSNNQNFDFDASVRAQMCPYHCTFTSNRSALDEADAVLFSAVDLKTERKEKVVVPLDMPTTRKDSQHWIILLFESPEHVLTNLRAFDNVFTATWSFRRDSDVEGTPIYAKMRNFKQLSNLETGSFLERFSDDFIKNKTKVAAWIVSNCDLQPSNRKHVVKLLRRFIPVDIYGFCGWKTCSDTRSAQTSCYHEISPEYKFYFAFENSLCADYVSEKPFAALEAGMVPVVYGLGNYDFILPKGSFINALDFESVHALASYLKYLDGNLTAYKRYFTWRQEYRKMNANMWCDVCKFVWTKGARMDKIPIKDLFDWWTHYVNGTKLWACIRPGYDVDNLQGIYLRWQNGK